MSNATQILLATNGLTLILMSIVEYRTYRILREIRNLRADLKEARETGRNLWNHIGPGARP